MIAVSKCILLKAIYLYKWINRVVGINSLWNSNNKYLISLAQLEYRAYV